MGLVGVLAKAITDKQLEMAASGGIPPRLGGGMVGSHGVERGVEGREGYGSIEPSRAYHRAMSGDLGVPKPDPLEGFTGASEDPDQLEELLALIERMKSEGPPPPDWHINPRGGSLGRALRTHHGGSRMFTQPAGGGMGRSMQGVQTADIPGAPEAAPWLREHADTEPEELRHLEPHREEPQPPLPPSPPRGAGLVGVTEPRLNITGDADLPEALHGLNLNALPPGFRAQLPKIAASMADRPQGTGHRRQE